MKNMPLKPLQIVDEFHVVFSLFKTTVPAGLYHFKLSVKTVSKHILISEWEEWTKISYIEIISYWYLILFQQIFSFIYNFEIFPLI